MVRFLHPLAFFSVILLLVGLIVVGADNVVLCANGCSPSVSDLRARLSLALLGPGLLFGVAAWNLAVTASIARRSWRSGAALVGIPLVVWIAVLTIAPALGIPALGKGSPGGLATCIGAGALTLLGLSSLLFVLPTPSTNATHPTA